MKHLLALALLATPTLLAEDGKSNYTLYCSACHAPDGKALAMDNSPLSREANGSKENPIV